MSSQNATPTATIDVTCDLLDASNADADVMEMGDAEVFALVGRLGCHSFDEAQGLARSDLEHLAGAHPHERDQYISFDEGPHVYTISLPGSAPTTSYTSVTTWVHQQFEEFDADKVIASMMGGRNWEKSQYFGKTPDEIKALWDENRDSAAQAGTDMHYDIECFYNNARFADRARILSPEFRYFLRFETERRRAQLGDAGTVFEKMVPFRTEWTVFDEDARVSGSIDMVYYKPDKGTYAIYDWKRCKRISDFPFKPKWSHTPCLSQIPDSNYWHYALQLNIYRNILRRKYGVTVDELCIVSLHPNQRSYERHRLPILQDEMDALFATREDN
jgi:hypothetical protein